MMAPRAAWLGVLATSTILVVACSSDENSEQASTSSGAGPTCGSLGACGADEYCFAQASCDLAGGAVECRPRPTSCGAGPQACGCDGNLYASICDANAAGVNVSDDNSCAAPTGTFACGALFCQIGAESCFVGPESGTNCDALPSGCSGAVTSCADCFASQPLAANCACSLQDGNVTVQCGFL